MMMNIDGWLIVFQHVWLKIDAHLEWLIELEYWKLKSATKYLHFVSFQQNKPLKPKNIAYLGKWAIPIVG